MATVPNTKKDPCPCLQEAPKPKNLEKCQNSSLVLRSIPAMEGDKVVAYVLQVVKQAVGNISWSAKNGVQLSSGNYHLELNRDTRNILYVRAPGYPQYNDRMCVVTPAEHEKIAAAVAEYNKTYGTQPVEITDDSLVLC